MKKRERAFTLAEVLITLGIIGVVAALTLPTLINNYEKKVTVTKLKHFSSVMQQMTNLRTAHSMENTTPTLPPLGANNPELLEQYFDVYYKPYLKIAKVEKLQKGLLVSLKNGSAFYLIKPVQCDSVTPWSCNLHIQFCPQYKYCKNINENAHVYPSGEESEALMNDGKHVFELYYDGAPPRNARTRSYDYVLEEVKNGNTFLCATLIKMDGWEITDDNPCWK